VSSPERTCTALRLSSGSAALQLPRGVLGDVQYVGPSGPATAPTQRPPLVISEAATASSGTGSCSAVRSLFVYQAWLGSSPPADSK
jgi:hypothetical protein